MTKPISPQEVRQIKVNAIPPEVIEAFNELIVRKFDGRSARVFQSEVVELIRKKLKLSHDDSIYNNHWLDVEPLFIKEGWTVKYDKPAYCETYEASFEFIKGKT